MKVFFNNGKYYTRVRWGTRKKDQGEVIFPLNTHEELVAEHRRDVIQDTSLRLKSSKRTKTTVPM